MGWNRILINVVVMDRESREQSPRETGARKVQGMGMEMGMLDLILKMSSEWQEERGCTQQSIARLGFIATGDC